MPMPLPLLSATTIPTEELTVLRAVAQWGTLTTWQLSAVLMRTVPKSVSLTLHRRLVQKLTRLCAEGWITLTSAPTTSRVLRSGERAEYRATPLGTYLAAGLRARRRAVLAALDLTDWTEEALVTAAFYSGIRGERFRRRRLQIMVQEHLLEVRREYEPGLVDLVAPTAKTHERLGRGRLMPPSARAIRHHLLTVECALGLLQEYQEPAVASPTKRAMAFDDFLWDEPLRSASRRGVNFVLLRGKRADTLPDGELWLRPVETVVVADGARHLRDERVCVPIEVITSDYKDEALRHKVQDLPPATRFFVETVEMAERMFDLTGVLPGLIPEIAAPLPSLVPPELERWPRSGGRDRVPARAPLAPAARAATVADWGDLEPLD